MRKERKVSRKIEWAIEESKYKRQGEMRLKRRAEKVDDKETVKREIKRDYETSNTGEKKLKRVIAWIERERNKKIWGIQREGGDGEEKGGWSVNRTRIYGWRGSAFVI